MCTSEPIVDLWGCKLFIVRWSGERCLLAVILAWWRSKGIGGGVRGVCTTISSWSIELQSGYKPLWEGFYRKLRCWEAVAQQLEYKVVGDALSCRRYSLLLVLPFWRSKPLFEAGNMKMHTESLEMACFPYKQFFVVNENGSAGCVVWRQQRWYRASLESTWLD